MKIPIRPNYAGMIRSVIKVRDGDAITADTTIAPGIPMIFRLADIDAPEYGEPRAHEAKELLAELLRRHPIDIYWTIRSGPMPHALNRYLVHLWHGPHYLQASMLRAGLAVPYLRWTPTDHQNLIFAAAADAASEGRGIYADRHHPIHARSSPHPPV